MERADLHRLIDTLPEGALENANRMLEHLNIFPRQPSPEMERMRQISREQREKMRRLIRPGTLGGTGGVGSVNPSTAYCHSGDTRWEDQTAVHETNHLFKGHEITVTERLRIADDGKAIHYTHEAKGPKGEPIVSKIIFDVW